MTDEKLVNLSISIARIVFGNIGIRIDDNFYTSLNGSINKMRGVKRVFEILSNDFSLLESGIDNVAEEEVVEWSGYIVKSILQAYYGTNSAFAATPKSVIEVSQMLLEILTNNET